MRDDDLKLAIEHHAAGRLDEAEQLYTRLHRADPSDAEVLFLLGVLSCNLGLFEPACRFLERVLLLVPNFPEARRQLSAARNGLAALALLNGDAAAAEEAFKASLGQGGPEPGANDAESFNRLGLAQLQQEKLADAEISLRQALRLQPDHNQARNNLGSALLQRGQVDEAQRCFEAALAQDPAYVSARINLAGALRIRARHGEARALLEGVLTEQPDSVEALNNLGTIAQDVGDAELAMTCLSRAVALAPDSPRVRWNLALSQLQAGEFKDGWNNFESRWEGCASLRGGYGMPPERAWRGECLRGKRLLLWAEQGFGDTLQFIRFAQDAASQGATVSAVVQGEVAALVGSVPGISDVTVQGATLPTYDLHCPLMSLPHRLGLPLDRRALHGDAPYMTAAPDKIDHWRRCLTRYGGIKVGLVWAGSSRRQSAELAAVDARRSIPPQRLGPILSVSGCSFFSLQKGASPGDAVAGLPARVHDFSAEWADFSDTAALLMNLDLIISVDTAVAHLAGALGKPVWLLNRYDACWRWLRSRTDTPWYASLRQFRQPAPGAWEPAIAAAAAELTQRASA